VQSASRLVKVFGRSAVVPMPTDIPFCIPLQTARPDLEGHRLSRTVHQSFPTSTSPATGAWWRGASWPGRSA